MATRSGNLYHLGYQTGHSISFVFQRVYNLEKPRLRQFHYKAGKRTWTIPPLIEESLCKA